jgi:hypothetical protein
MESSLNEVFGRHTGKPKELLAKRLRGSRAARDVGCPESSRSHKKKRCKIFWAGRSTSKRNVPI